MGSFYNLKKKNCSEGVTCPAESGVWKKLYMGFLTDKIWQILKRFSRIEHKPLFSEEWYIFFGFLEEVFNHLPNPQINRIKIQHMPSTMCIIHIGTHTYMPSPIIFISRVWLVFMKINRGIHLMNHGKIRV